MLLVRNTKIFVRKMSHVHFLLNSLRPEIRHALLKHFSWRVTSNEVKPKNNSEFLEKFLEDGRGARLNPSCVGHGLELDHRSRFPRSSNHSSKPTKNSSVRIPRSIKALRAQKLGESLLECRKTFSPISSTDDDRLNLVVLEVANHKLHSYDPVYLVVKPFHHTSDDILAGQDESLLESNVISRQNYEVTFLGNSVPLVLPPDDCSFTLHCSSLPELDKQTNSPQKTWDTPEVLKQVPSDQEHSNRPNEEKLERIFKRLTQILPRFFVQPHDYAIYHPDVVFENNIRGLTTVGIAAYVKQLAVVRLMAHLKFAHVRMDVLKITKHPEDFTVRVRWRIRGISGLKVFLKIWKVRFWNWRELLNQESDWYDGFSIFYVGADGLITKHVCDRMMPDEEKEVNVPKGLLAAKLAFLLGLSQRPFLEDLDAMAVMLLKLEEMNYFARAVAK